MQTDYFTRLLGIQGFVVNKISIGKEAGRRYVILDLKRERPEYVCRGCQQRVAEVKGYRNREGPHLRWWEQLRILRVQQYRVICPRCGVKVEELPFVEKYSRVTRSLAAQVYELGKVMTGALPGMGS